MTAHNMHKPGITSFNTMKPEQNGCRFTNNNFKCIFFYENDRILIGISLKFVPKSQFDNKSALVQVMAWHQKGNKPLSEPMLNWFTDAYMQHQGGMS